MNFITLTEYYSHCSGSNLNTPNDWNDKNFDDYIFLKTKCTDLLVFKLEDREGSGTFFACTEQDNDLAMSDKNLYIAEDNNELLSETREQIKVIYRLLTQHKEASFDDLEIKEENFDNLDVSYLEIFQSFELQFIEFKDTSYSEILLSYIFYKINTDYNKCETKIDIESIQDKIKDICLNEQYKEHMKNICKYFSYREDEHLFISFYSYLESQCKNTEKEPLLNSFCSNCTALAFCDECIDILKKPLKSTNWNSVRIVLKKNINQFQINNNFKLYADLKKHRNDLFHHNENRDEAWGIISNGFKECLYSMLLSILLLIENKKS